MKKVDEFSAEEIGEEWLRELYKVVHMRRGTMFRLITESARLLLLGNAGGAALIIGFMSSPSGVEDAAYHWLALATLLVFATGTLASALTMILVAMVAVKEAHSAEEALKSFADRDIGRTQVLFTLGEQTFRIADYSLVSGAVSMGGFMLGGVSSILLLMLFF